jgi:hypothetical protein
MTHLAVQNSLENKMRNIPANAITQYRSDGRQVFKSDDGRYYTPAAQYGSEGEVTGTVQQFLDPQQQANVKTVYGENVNDYWNGEEARYNTKFQEFADQSSFLSGNAPVAAPATPTVPEPPVLPSSDIQPATTAPVAPTTTASPTMATATTSNIDPTIQPYLSYGLSEAQKQYQAGGPQYYGGQTFVSPSETTQTGLQALEQRASRGSPLTGAAQGQLQNTIQGGYLQGNPFFQGAFQPAAQAAESKFLTSLGNIGSAASKAGRYGSGAMNTMQQGASGQFAKTLADTAGALAYENYAAERGRQQAATMAAPQMAQADYGDIQNMLKAGQLREGYTGAQQQADINKFNFQQNQPQVNLTNYLSGVYGNPLGRMQQSAGGGQAGPSGFQNLLGGAATAAGIYKTLGGTQGLSNIGNWLTGGGGGSGSFVPDPTAYAFGSQSWE